MLTISGLDRRAYIGGKAFIYFKLNEKHPLISCRHSRSILFFVEFVYLEIKVIKPTSMICVVLFIYWSKKKNLCVSCQQEMSALHASFAEGHYRNTNSQAVCYSKVGYDNVQECFQV